MRFPLFLDPNWISLAYLDFGLAKFIHVFGVSATDISQVKLEIILYKHFTSHQHNSDIKTEKIYLLSLIDISSIF